MHYDLTDLRILVWIADLGSFAAAAKRANLSVSALSDRIRRLEEEAGVPLLERSARGSIPTSAGLELIAHARAIQTETDRLNFTVSAWKHRDNGVIRVAANSHALAASLPLALASFMAKNKGAFVQVREDLSDAIGRMVSEGTVDLGIAGASAQFPNLELVPFPSGWLGLLVPQGHPLGERRSIRFRETLELAQISLEERSAISIQLTEKAQSIGRDFVATIRLRGFETVCRMVAEGVGISILPSSAIPAGIFETGARFVPLAEDWAECTLVLCLPLDRPVSRAVRRLAEDIAKAEMHHSDFARRTAREREDRVPLH